MDALKLSLSALGAVALVSYIIWLRGKLSSARSTVDTFRARLIEKVTETAGLRREVEHLKMEIRVQQQRDRAEYERNAKYTQDSVSRMDHSDTLRKLREAVNSARGEDGGDSPGPVHPPGAPKTPKAD